MVEIIKTTSRDSAEEIIKKKKAAEKRTQDLRDRWEADWQTYILSDFVMNVARGKIDTVTCNSPAVMVGKTIEYLADGDFKYTIPLRAKEAESKRDKINLNELFVYSMIASAERLQMAYPENPSLQAACAFYVVLFGWSFRRVLLWKKKPDDEVICDIAEWDPSNVYWGNNSKGLAWAINRRFATEEEFEERYNTKPNKVEKDGRIELLDHWDGEAETIVAGGDSLKPNKHGLGYVPVSIRSCGATPLRTGTLGTDNIKRVGEGILAPNRSIYPIENELASYKFSAIRKGIRTPKVLRALTPDTTNPFDGDPFATGGVAIIDGTKYGELQNFQDVVMPPEADRFWSEVQGMKNMGGLAPISFGDVAQQQTAQGMNILNHNAMTLLKPRKKTMEQQYDWTCDQIISQYCNEKRKFPEMEFNGVSRTQESYDIKVSPDKLEPKRHIVSELQINLPYDKMQEADLALKLRKEGVISLQRTMDEVGIEDTDAEKRVLDREFFGELYRLYKAEDALIENGTPEDFKMVWRVHALIKMQEAQIMAQMMPGAGQGAPGGAPSPGGEGAPGMPGGMVRRTTASFPGRDMASVQKRLAEMEASR